MTEERVDILDEVSLELVDCCCGPTTAGYCARVGPDRVVACAGRRIAPTGAGPEHWLMRVPPGTQQCPLAWNLAAVGY